MTEYNLFCWAKKYNDDNSFQQARYRVFNTQMSKEEYQAIKIPRYNLEFDPQESYETRYQTAFKKMWKGLTQEQKQEFFDIPHFNWEGFTFITGIEKEESEVEEITMEALCKELGREVKIKK